MKKIIIYADHILFINGLYTWMINFCREFHDIYDITILSRKYSTRVRNDLNKYVYTDIWREDAEYNCYGVIYQFDFSVNPTNIISEKNFTILHCDYSKVQGKVTINPNTKYIAVSELAATKFTEKYGIPCDNIESILPQTVTKKILHLVSCTRMTQAKGAERIYQLAHLLDLKGIKYQWLNFSDKDMMNMEFIKNHINPNIIHMPPLSNEELRDYIADSDYLVQLSDHEGYCFAVHEALSLKTPVIVTDIPIFDELVQDGVNGYKVPLDLQNIDINSIVNKIPNNFKPYIQPIEEIKKKWTEELLC